jgi:glycosyltransferase involved in cell wall biosynthesis
MGESSGKIKCTVSIEQNNTLSEALANKQLRPVLIASKRIANEYTLFLRHLLAGLADESIATALVYPPAYDVDSIVSPSIEVIRYPAVKLPLMGPQNKQILMGELKKFEPTLLHCLCESEAGLVRHLAKQMNLPYVLTVNSLQKRLGGFGVSSTRCAKIIAPTRSIAVNLGTIYPEFAGRIVQINTGTFVDRKSMCFSRRDQLATIVMVHPLNDVKDFEKPLAAMKRLAIDGYEFMLAIIGDGRAERLVRKRVAELGLSESVIIIPRIEPWHSVLAAGDIFIQPQPSNSFNPVALEAMSVGTVVTCSKGGVDDLIIDDQTGVMFEQDIELSIYTNLKQLLDRREWARQLAKAAQEHLKKNHSVSKMISSILAVYREAQNLTQKQI